MFSSNPNKEHVIEQQEDASFEMLDQTQHGDEHKFRPELLIGLALVLAIAGWGAFDWWQHQARLNSYFSAKQYAAARDWDAALDAYTAAGDYADAKDRASEADNLIKVRNSAYDAANRAAYAHDWLNSLTYLRTVVQIQPQYRDVSQLLAPAERWVYSEALSGTVALRLNAEPPGLYLRRADGWTWLEGSDAASQVLGYHNSCCVVYDVPAAGAASERQLPTPNPTAVTYDPNMTHLSGRRAVVARREQNGLNYKPLNIDPAGFYYFGANESSIVAYGYDPLNSASLDPRVVRVEAYSTAARFVYQDYSSPLTTTFSLPDPGWALISDIDENNSFIVGDYTNNKLDSLQTDLYLSDFGGNRRLLAKLPAVVVWARRSPDGRYLLLKEYVPRSSTTEEQDRLILWPLDGSGETTLITRPRDTYEPVHNSEVTGFFVQKGPLAGKLITIQNTNHTARLIDPANPNQILWSRVGSADEESAGVTSSDDGLLLLWRTVSAAWQKSPGTVLYLDANYQQTEIHVPQADHSVLWTVWHVNGWLIYATYTGSEQDLQIDLKTVKANSNPDDAATPTDFYAVPGTELTSNRASGGALLWRTAPNLFTYVKDGELHVRNYNGSNDTVMENGLGPFLWGPYY